jgi:non-ribosomal peptide synthetase component E (peptide arylation enzyme)
VREDAVGNKYLCAYVLLLHQEEEKKKIQLKSYLSQYLPDYMIPSQFVFLEKFPLKINGKPDISGLPDPLSINR